MKIHTMHSELKIFTEVFQPPNLIFLIDWHLIMLRLYSRLLCQW